MVSLKGCYRDNMFVIEDSFDIPDGTDFIITLLDENIKNKLIDPIYLYADELLNDAAQADKEIADGTAKIYNSPKEMFDDLRRN
ncbi:MAG: hypothetical protein FWG90_03870 [Oscillospiraceae bacterium]|nr:hypothetical protein [Oscillospiraceae bacterium]